MVPSSTCTTCRGFLPGYFAGFTEGLFERRVKPNPSPFARFHGADSRRVSRCSMPTRTTVRQELQAVLELPRGILELAAAIDDDFDASDEDFADSL